MPVPDSLQPKVDACISQFQNGDSRPGELEPVLQWIEDAGWDELWASDAEHDYYPTIDMDELSGRFNDSELRDFLELEDDYLVEDADRTQYARILMKQELDGEGADPMCFDSYVIQATDGSMASIGCITTEHGPYGRSFSWCGLWKSEDEFLGSVGRCGQFWIPSRMDAVSDAAILSRWKKDPLA